MYTKNPITNYQIPHKAFTVRVANSQIRLIFCDQHKTAYSNFPTFNDKKKNYVQKYSFKI